METNEKKPVPVDMDKVLGRFINRIADNSRFKDLTVHDAKLLVDLFNESFVSVQLEGMAPLKVSAETVEQMRQAFDDAEPLKMADPKPPLQKYANESYSPKKYME